MKPNYTKIYNDLIVYRNKQEKITPAIADEIQNLRTARDIIELELKIFGKNVLKDKKLINHQLRSYDEESIREILKDQRINQLNNTQVADKYQLSRNTIAKWKKIYS